MELLIIIAVIFSGGTFFLNLFNNKQRSISAPPARKAITGTAAPKGHTLKKLYVKKVKYSSGESGWTWECECGISDVFPNYPFNRSGEPESPTEGYVMQRWKLHAQLHGNFTSVEEENEWKFKFDIAIQEFDAYKKKCFCKDLH